MPAAVIQKLDIYALAIVLVGVRIRLLAENYAVNDNVFHAVSFRFKTRPAALANTDEAPPYRGRLGIHRQPGCRQKEVAGYGGHISSSACVYDLFLVGLKSMRLKPISCSITCIGTHRPQVSFN